MELKIKQAITALEFYLSRSQMVMDYLEQDNLVEAFAALKKKTAAFQNFKVADRLLLQAGTDISTFPEAKVLFGKIVEIDEKLKSILGSHKQRIYAKLNEQIKFNKKINQYETGSLRDNGLQLKI